MGDLGKDFVRNLQKLCKIVRRCLIKYVSKRGHEFLGNCTASDNISCHICQNSAARELNIYTSHGYFFNLVQYHLSISVFYYVFFCVSFSQLLFNFRLMLCYRFWRIKMNICSFNISAVARTWNSFPAAVASSNSLQTSKTKLKSHLFLASFLVSKSLLFL